MHRLFKRVKSLKLNQNILIFGFFLLISFLFWFLNALSNIYNTEISIPIEYSNSPENKLIAEVQATTIKIKITAVGYRIINYKTTSIDPVIISLSRYKPKSVEGTNNKKFFILSQSLKEEIMNAVGKDLNVSIIGPDSLIFSMDEVITKKLPVLKNFTVGFKKQFMLKNDISLSPDSVLVKGVKSLLDTLSEVFTKYDKLTDLDASQIYEIDLINIPGIEFSSNRVHCNIEVEEFTEMKYELPIEVINLPDQLKIKIYPANATIAVNVGFSRYQTIYRDQFRLIADYKEAGDSQVSRLRVKVAKAPENISTIRIYPQSVDFIIEKND